jgi:hypothetical protein
MNEKTKTCPICPRECDLASPNCGRGEEFARTGVLPKESENRHGHSHEHGHDHRQRLQFEKKEQKLVMKYLHHAVRAADHGGITQEKAGEMFSVLTDEETVQLASLLQKLSDHWMELAIF